MIRLGLDALSALTRTVCSAALRVAARWAYPARQSAHPDA